MEVSIKIENTESDLRSAYPVEFREAFRCFHGGRCRLPRASVTVRWEETDARFSRATRYPGLPAG
jgi:hypothetical protein